MLRKKRENFPKWPITVWFTLQLIISKSKQKTVPQIIYILEKTNGA